MKSLFKLEKLGRLSEIKSTGDIIPLSNAQFPGTHCPLFGVALATWNIQGLLVLVIGTEECAYYTKNFVMMRERSEPGPASNRFFSCCLEQRDIVFGSQEELLEIVEMLYRNYAPEGIMLVTTCLPELTGENFEGTIRMIRERINTKLLLVKTDHFSCKSHIPGIERALEALIGLMEEQPLRKGTVNLLGQRYQGLSETELVRNLRGKGINVNLALPCSGNVQLIREAPGAALNIVTDHTGLALAERMKERFNRDYVVFQRFASPERIAAAYREISAGLGINLDGEIRAGELEVERAAAECARLLSGKSFVYGNSPLPAFELSRFLTGLGMIPLLIQARELYDEEAADRAALLDAGFNPYVTRVANIAPLPDIYRQIRPHFYIGHENPERLAAYGISQVVLDRTAAAVGFEVPVRLLRMMAEAAQRALTSEKGRNHAII